MIKLLKMDSAGRNKIFGDMDSPCLGLMFLKFGEIQNSARRRGLGRNAGGCFSKKIKLVLKLNKKARVSQSDDAGLFFEGLDNKQPTSFG